jgi:hypothetical protein
MFKIETLLSRNEHRTRLTHTPVNIATPLGIITSRFAAKSFAGHLGPRWICFALDLPIWGKR